MANRDIKLAAAGVGVRMWQIADELGIMDCNFSRKLRHELSDDEKAAIFEIISRLARSQEGSGEDAKTLRA